MNNRNTISNVLLAVGLLIMVVMALMPLLELNQQWMRWAFAAGAVAYKWTKNGKALSGGANGNLTVTWAKGGAVDTYTVTAIYSVSGVETEGTPVTFTVTNRQLGLSILLR